MPISVREDVFAAEADGLLVFLDLARDRYCALDRAWSRRAIDAQANDALDAILIDKLRQARLWQEGGKTELALTRHLLADAELAENGKTNPASFVRAAVCRLAAARRLKRRHIAQIVAGQRAQRARWRAMGGAATEEALFRKAREFRALQPLAPRAGACLENALALLSFLGRDGAEADWVFAVKGAPFSAHCWVQHGRTVLNDSLANTAGYAPIMIA